MTHTVLEVRHRHLTWLSSWTWVHSAQGFLRVGRVTGWMDAGVESRGRWQTDGLALSCRHTSSHNRCSADVRRQPSVIRSKPLSAALDVLLDDHAAVSEERAGQWLQERPGVGARVEGLHVAEGRTLAAHDPSCGVDFSVQDHSTENTQTQFCLVQNKY